ncbi:MAG: D-glycero-beta-D-manno-heptose-7-phosphate kinase [Desulfobacterales bacterium]|nr:D-glycero-beta-D-manno-heptose-7-phosphate kinase [Nanoarchaeota archaeon]MCG2778906.1 D-glycero-beta-D-manno-heptose-7-phosphate kinase [Desulfobacterales bacterium]
MKNNITVERSSKDLRAFVNALDKFSNRRVLVIGDIIVDEYLWGSVERISPEAPVQIVQVEKQEYRLGGCGNVVNNLRSLGAEVVVASVIGDGYYRQFVLDELNLLGVNTQCLLLDEGRPMTKKTRVVAANQQVVRIDFEITKSIARRYENLINEFVDSNLSLCDAILLSDYSKGVVTKRVASLAINNAKKLSIPAIVDPKGRKFSKYFGATIITPNAKEAEMASNIEIKGDSSAEKAAHRILMSTKCDAVLITRGKHGMTLLEGSNRGAVHIPAQAREVFDVSGAGDTVLAVLGLAIASGLCFEEASYLANIAGGIVVGKLGTSTLKKEDLLAALNINQSSTGTFKEKTLEELENLVLWLKEEKESVVFTNGNFGVLHGGHVELLQQAKRLGDILIVGIKSDCAVWRLRGASYPLIEQKERVKILSALDCVDYVVITGDQSLLKIIQQLHPDVIVTQRDGFGALSGDIVEKELLESYSGRIVSIELENPDQV